MNLHDAPTADERAAADRRFEHVVARGAHRRRRRRAVLAGATATLVALVAGVSLALVASPERTPTGPDVAAAGSTTTTTAPPPVTVLATATTQLKAYVAAAAAADQAAAQRAGAAWTGDLSSPPVVDDGGLVAVAAFSYDPAGTPVHVLAYAGGRWSLVTALPAPHGAAGWNGSWLADPASNGYSISVADVTGDGRPDFLIPLMGADNTPGAVVSEDGATPPATWRYVLFTDWTHVTTDVVARSPAFRGTTLVSTYDNCVPDCAQGTSSTITWTYDRSAGVFRAPDPPGWTAPPGATNHAG